MQGAKIRYLETAFKEAEPIVWAYANAKVLERDLRAYYGRNYKNIKRDKVDVTVACHTEFWNDFAEHLDKILENGFGKKEAFNLGSVLTQDLTQEISERVIN